MASINAFSEPNFATIKDFGMPTAFLVWEMKWWKKHELSNQ